jgi:hypothetical protein
MRAWAGMWEASYLEMCCKLYVSIGLSCKDTARQSQFAPGFVELSRQSFNNVCLCFPFFESDPSPLVLSPLPSPAQPHYLRISIPLHLLPNISQQDWYKIAHLVLYRSHDVSHELVFDAVGEGPNALGGDHVGRNVEHREIEGVGIRHCE